MDSALRVAQYERAARFLKSVSVVHRQPAPSQPKREAPEVPQDCFKLLVKAGLEPEQRLMDLYEQLGLHPAKAKQALSFIEAKALGRVHALARKGRGGGPYGLEVLERGIALLKKHGIQPADKIVTRGGWRHDVYGRWIRLWAKRQGLTCSFEQKVGDKIFDAVTRDREGTLTGFEIILSGSVALNADQAAKAACVAGVQDVVLLAEDAKLLKRLQTRVAQCAGESVSAKLRYALMGDFSPF